MLSLVKAGYGDYPTVASFDTNLVLDMIEFEDIELDIRNHNAERLRDGSG